MMGTFLSFYFYFFLKAKIQTSAFAEFTESFLQYLIKAELGLLEARVRYENTLKKIDKFDVVLLSIGEDGHIASLFPNHIYPEDQMVVVEKNSPKLPMERISMSYSRISTSENILIIIVGKLKQKAVRLMLDKKNLPINKIIINTGKVFIHSNAIGGKCNPPKN